MTNEILKAIGESDFEYYGIRVDDGIAYQVGDLTADSRVWVDGDPTDDTLDGTSTVGFRFTADASEIAAAIETAQQYFGGRWYLLGGNSAEYGEDAGEVIIKDAEVVAILR